MIQLKLCLTERNRKNSISSFYMDLIPNKNFICIIDTSIDVSNSSQKGSGDFLELSRKSDGSVINELLKPDLLAHPGSCAPFSAYLSNNSQTQQSHLKHHKALCPLHVAKHAGLTWNMLNLLNKLELQNMWAAVAASFQWAVRAGQGNRIQTHMRSEYQCLTLHNVTWGRQTLSSLYVF